jgi:serine/threonine protein kinase, bacterial
VNPLETTSQIDEEPARFLRSVGNVFAVFDAQDSGNVSYGVRADGEQYFVKTAGRPDNPHPMLTHPERVDLLRNAVRLTRSCHHPALPKLHHVIESPTGPLLIYEWLNGELLGVPRSRRADPEAPNQRFQRLSVATILRCLDTVFELHMQLARHGWIAVDFYDGCLIYDFARDRLGIVDLDNYHQGPFRNQMGRMFGSARFMAPEEFERGAVIDQRTNVFVMGRTALLLLSDGTLNRDAFRGPPAAFEVASRACKADRPRRYDSLAAFYDAWQAARRNEEGLQR